MPKSPKPRRDIYQEVTDKILDALSKGTVPWHQPWVGASLPVSMSTGRPYRGVNVFVLAFTAQAEGYTSPWWGTYKQISERGGQVLKGQKGSTVILWRPVEKKDAAGHVVERFMVLRAYNVFNECQAEWPEGSRQPKPFETVDGADTIEVCDEILAKYLSSGPALFHGGDDAYYAGFIDTIQMPEKDQFKSSEGYYSALFHETIHSTGHKSRLDRDGVVKGHKFGSVDYSKEELIAEMGAAMLAGLTGIDQVTLPNSAAYIANWIQVLDNDPKMVVQAGAAAQRAVDLAASITFEVEDEKDEEVAA